MTTVQSNSQCFQSVNIKVIVVLADIYQAELLTPKIMPILVYHCTDDTVHNAEHLKQN